MKSNQEKDQKPPEKHTITKKVYSNSSGTDGGRGVTIATRKMATHYEARTTVFRVPETDI